jgi:hypothetical protein
MRDGDGVRSGDFAVADGSLRTGCAIGGSLAMKWGTAGPGLGSAVFVCLRLRASVAAKVRPVLLQTGAVPSGSRRSGSHSGHETVAPRR